MKEEIQRKLEALAHHQLYLGTSSWKYEGWKGLIYTRPYKTIKSFNENCLSEYAEVFPTIGVDHTYYAWPSPTTFERYVDITPAEFKFILKVTEKITVFRYPNLKRYGKDAGKLNPSFLDPEVFKQEFLEPLLPFKDRLGPVMLEFSQFHPGMIASGKEFVDRLDRFFSAITEREIPFSVEIRNRQWLHPSYFETLVKHGVSHVFNSWTKMPTLSEQLEAAEKFELPFYIARLLLNPGVSYETAVEAYAPYNHLHEQHLEIRNAAVDLLERATTRKKPAFVFANNRFEGCSPLTLAAIADLFFKRTGVLSPAKKDQPVD